MTLTRLSEMIHEWMGWCPNAPPLRTAPAALVVPPVTIHPAQPSGGTGIPGRIRIGVSIATGSITTLIRKKHLLWFPFLAGLVMGFMIAANYYFNTHLELVAPFLFGIPFAGTTWVFDLHILLVEGVCIFCINILLAGVVLSMVRESNGKRVALREAFRGTRHHLRPLLAWSVIMAVAGTLIYTWFMQDPALRGVHTAIDMSAFFIPYVYYVPDAVGSAIFFSIWLLLIDALLFLLSLFVVPVIVLEKRGLAAALAGSIALVRRTWGEITGCYLIFVLIALGISFISVIICLTPVFVNHDYDFFLSWYRGRLLMTAICFLYIAGWWALMAIGSTVAGIAIARLYTYGKTGKVPAGSGEN